MSRTALDTVMVIMGAGVVLCVVISLIGMVVLAWVHDGTLAQTAMQQFSSVAQWALIGGGLWGMTHTVMAGLRPGSDTPAAAAAPTPAVPPVA